MRHWTVVGICVVLGGCFGPEGSDPDADAGQQDAAARDGGAQDGGRPGDGGRDSGFHLPDGAMTLDAGHAFDAGSPAFCNLPPDSGPCDAAITRWAWNPELGACEQFSYGGCGGNENNFTTPLECLQACAPRVDAGFGSGAACQVGGQVFPSGAGGIDDPHSCNTCICVDGQLACTEIACSEECPPNSLPSTGCAACGPVDNCEIVAHGCFPVCSDASQCVDAEFGSCFDGVCKELCG